MGAALMSVSPYGDVNLPCPTGTLRVSGSVSALGGATVGGVTVTLQAQYDVEIARMSAELALDPDSTSGTYQACFDPATFNNPSGNPADPIALGVVGTTSDGIATVAYRGENACVTTGPCEFNVTMQGSAQVIGTITGGGQPLEGAHVWIVVGSGQNAHLVVELATDVNGNWKAGGLAPDDTYVAYFGAPDSMPQYLPANAPFIITDPQVDPVLISTELQLANITLNVVDQNGDPATAPYMQAIPITNDTQPNCNVADSPCTWFQMYGSTAYLGLTVGTWDLYVQPDNAALVPTTHRAVVDASGALASLEGDTTGAIDSFVVDPALWSATLLSSAGDPVANTNVFAQVAGTQDCQIPNTCFNAFTNAQGQFTLNLPNGDYRLNGFPPYGSTSLDVQTAIDITMTDGIPTSWNGATPDLANLTLQMKQANALFQVNGVNGPLPGVFMGASQYFGQNNWQFAGGSQSNAFGVSGLNLAPGIYGLNANRPDGADQKLYSNFQRNILVEDDGNGGIRIKICPNNYSPDTGPCANPGSLPIWTPDAGSGYYVFDMPRAEVIGTLCEPGTGGANPTPCVVVPYAGASVFRQVPVSNGVYNYNPVTWANADVNGVFAAALGDPGRYRLTAQKARTSTANWVDTSVYVEKDASGNVCLLQSEDGPCTTANTGSLADLVITFRTGNVNGTVLGVGGSPLTDAWIDLSKVCPDYEGCRQWLPGTSLTNAGTFSFDLAAGDYILSVRPFSSTDGSVTTTYNLTVPQDLTVAPVTIQMRGASARGVVTTTNGPAAYAQIGVEQLVNGGWSWLNLWTQANASGEFGLALDPGTYRLRVEPSAADRANASTAYATIVLETVSGNTVVTSATGAGSLSGGLVNISLPIPNAAGRVLAGTDPAPNAWVEVKPWNVQSAQYVWDQNVQGASANSLGEYALTLPSGRYQLVANPPWGVVGLTRSTIEVCVDGSNTYLGTACTGTPITPGTLDVTLGEPNVTGTITAGGSPAGYGWVEVQKKSPYGWDWADYSNASGTGDYSLNFTQPGTFRVNANPPSTLAGYAKTSKYLIAESVSGSIVMCEVSEAEAASATTCADASKSANASLSLPIALQGANLYVKVQDGTNAGQRDAWLGVLTGSDSVGWTWTGGVSTNSSGLANMRLEALNSVDTQYRLEVNPPWTSTSGLTRKNVDVTALTTGDVCLAADFATNAHGCTPIGSADVSRYVITLTQGNVAGEVLQPAGSATAPNSTVNVEKWTQQPWTSSGDYYWAWINNWANANADGQFTLQLDPGTYRITGYPSWDNASGASKGSAVVTVQPDGTWCEQTLAGATPAASVTYGSETVFGSCEPDNTARSLLDVRLAAPTVSGVILDAPGGVPVTNAWVSVARYVIYDEVNGYGYYSYEGGAPTNRLGQFNLALTQGRYQLDVNPPWQGTGSDGTRFTQEIYVTCDAGACTFAKGTEPGGAPTYSAASPIELAFPPASVVGTVCDKDSAPDSCEPVTNSWISVQQFIGGVWTWTNYGASTNSLGQFRLALPRGESFRLTAQPSWQNPDGLSNSVDVLVPVEGTATPQITLRKANVNGTVVYAGTTPMPGAWVEVTDGGQWVAGSGTNSSGQFAFALLDGIYTFTAYPNSTLSSKPPVTETVTVSGGVVTSPNPLVMDVDAIPPNVTVGIDPGLTTGAHLIAVYVDDAGSWVLMPSLSARTDGSSVNEVSFSLTEGSTYRFVVVPNEGETLPPNEGLVTVDSSAGTQSVTVVAVP